MNRTVCATALLSCLLLSACSDHPRPTVPVTDQCLRLELLKQCMASLPAGPVATQYNDWNEVVSECKGFAYFTSQRLRQYVKPECLAE